MMFRSSVLLLVLSATVTTTTTTAFTVSPGRTNVARLTTLPSQQQQPPQQLVVPSVHDLTTKLFSTAPNGDDADAEADGDATEPMDATEEPVVAETEGEEEPSVAEEEPSVAEEDTTKDDDDDEDTTTTPVEEESTVEEIVAEDGDVAEEEAEDEVVAKDSHDSDLKALKDEIASLEATLKGKQSTLSRIQDDIDKYSKAGYARRVAQMEDMKKIRLSMQSSNKETAKATVVQNFLPVLDDLRALREVYEEDEFGSKYNGLTGNLVTALKELGVEEYTVTVGDVADPQRVTAVEEEYSESVEKGKVIRPVAMGMEIDGNVMRMAQAVISLGSNTSEEDSGDSNEGDDGKEQVILMDDYADE